MTGLPLYSEQNATLHLLFAAPDEPWREDALCREVGIDLFFAEGKGNPGGDAEAKQLCKMCAVSGECLGYAIAHQEDYGVWGGLGPAERKRWAA